MWWRGKEGIGLLSGGDYSGALGQYIRYLLRNADPRRTGLSIVTGGKKKKPVRLGFQIACGYAVSFSFLWIILVCLQLNGFHWHECILPNWLCRDYK